ncbi:hypothetical protein EVJ58_g10083 [Rhodofomes roseus]|uniref:Uncharacterized protein n=1 Tax=Rhodofomes roseus TaxID=34475 RepID=A0A4Y9XQF7_9APHY|nr:hypothetical protein EVJ58_g10083 [Rhodofomes roseus]
MWGFNVTAQTFPYDNRPVAPLTEYTFDQWWFHGHLDYPPNDGDIFELPAGQPVTTQIACDKGATTFFASDPGGDIQNGDDPCPGSPPSEYHTTGFDDLKGCALAITYKSNVSDVQPEDFTVFSVNQTCVWYRFTDFQVPARMPACPEGGCICAWLWIHSPDSGGEQNYMNGFRCNVTGATSDVALATPQVPRRCGADLDNGRVDASFSNCTWGAKQPFYWLQQERNNMFEGYYSPPFYTNLYNFLDGAQQDIFQDSRPRRPARRADCVRHRGHARARGDGNVERRCGRRGDHYLRYCEFSFVINSEYGVGCIDVGIGGCDGVVYGECDGRGERVCRDFNCREHGGCYGHRGPRVRDCDGIERRTLGCVRGRRVLVDAFFILSDIPAVFGFIDATVIFVFRICICVVSDTFIFLGCLHSPRDLDPLAQRSFSLPDPRCQHRFSNGFFLDLQSHRPQMCGERQSGQLKNPSRGPSLDKERSPGRLGGDEARLASA